MAVPGWQIRVAEALPRASTGEVPLVAVFCPGATVAEVKKFLEDMDAPSVEPDSGGEEAVQSDEGSQYKLNVNITLHQVNSEEDDYDGVDVIASPYPSLIRVYERSHQVPAGILRAALMRLLEGEPASGIAARLDDMIRNGHEDGDPEEDVSGERAGINVYLGNKPSPQA